MKLNDLFRHHRYKFIVGTPIIFLILLNTSGVGTAGNILFFTAAESIFVSVGDSVPIRLEVSSKSSVNAIGGTVLFPPMLLQTDSVTRSTSMIDLWSEEPLSSNTAGSIHWSGGIVREDAQQDLRGTIFVINFRAITEGKAKLFVDNGQLLANDGEGTNILSGAESFTIYIRAQGRPSPDVTGDGTLSLSDVNMLYLKTFRPYDARYDLNGDNKVSWGDVMNLIGLL